MSLSRGQAKTGLEEVCILIVDDTASMRSLLKLIAQSLGVGKILEAANGADAIEMLQAHRADIIFVDWAMDVMDGCDFVRRVRSGADGVDRFTPIIMITGHSDAEHVRTARDIGVTEFLAKPVSPKALAQRIEAIIHRPRPFVRTASFFGPDRRRKVESFEGINRRRSSEAEDDLVASGEEWLAKQRAKSNAAEE